MDKYCNFRTPCAVMYSWFKPLQGRDNYEIAHDYCNTLDRYFTPASSSGSYSYLCFIFGEDVIILLAAIFTQQNTAI